VYYNPKTGQTLNLRPPAGTYALAFSPDGRFLATATWGKTYVWELATAGLRCRMDFNAESLVFTPDGLLCVGARGYGGVLDWRAAEPAPVLLVPDKELEPLWSDLGSADAAVAHRALAGLAAAPAQVVPLLGKRLRLIESVPAADLDRWIKELDDKKFAVRQQALARLQGLAEAARPALQRALAGKLSAEAKRRIEELLVRLETQPRIAERVRLGRGVELLEYLGTEPARWELERLAAGMPGAAETEEAQAALRRLKDRG
jgi:hypothetical protein